MTKLQYDHQQMCVLMAQAMREDLHKFAKANPNLGVEAETVDLTVAAVEAAVNAIFEKTKLASTRKAELTIESLAIAGLPSLSFAYQAMMSASALNLTNNSEWKAMIELYARSAQVGSHRLLNQLVGDLQAKDAAAAQQQGEQNAN